MADEFDPTEVASETMAGDLLSCLLDEIKALPDVWQKLPMHQQDEVIWRLRSRVTDVVRQAVHTIASENRPTLVATVEKVEFKDGVKATLVMSKANPHRHDLADSQGEQVLVVVASAEQHMGGADEVKADPEQRDLLDDSNSDPLYIDAVNHVLETKRATASAVQRALKVGYNRACRLLERMEREGVVSPLSTHGTREVLKEVA